MSLFHMNDIEFAIGGERNDVRAAINPKNIL